MIPKAIIVTAVILSGISCATTRRPQPRYMVAFEKPSIDCVEVAHHLEDTVNEYACPAEPKQVAANVTAVTPCDESLWRHVYHPARLHKRQQTDSNPSSCISVTGVTVDATNGKQKDGCRHEADGDGHCWLKLDKGQEGLLADGNVVRQQGNLVFEPICKYETTQADAVATCWEWSQDMPLPPIGSHVRITGAFVFDAQHKHNELHPVTKIEVLP